MSGVRAWTLADGSFREGAEVPVTDRGFRYGMSVFETLAVRNGRMLFLRQHLAALESACTLAGFPADGADALMELEGLSDGLLRIYVTAGDGASDRGCRPPPHLRHLRARGISGSKRDFARRANHCGTDADNPRARGVEDGQLLAECEGAHRRTRKWI